MNDAKNIIKNLSTEEADELASIELDEALNQMQNLVKSDFLNFVRYMWPEFIEGDHHRLIGEKFNSLATGKINQINR